MLRRLYDEDDDDDDGDPDFPLAGEDLDEYFLRLYSRAVGGRDALDRLDDAPLPDEQLRVQDIPADIRDRVRDIAALADGVVVDIFDPEIGRAACRVSVCQ